MTTAHVTICQPLSGRMSEEDVRRYASRLALEYPDGAVALTWADGTREEFSRQVSGCMPRAGEGTVLTASCMTADAVYGGGQ